jgi:hypothetical protein
VRHHDLVVVGRVRVAQTREHVCDGVRHRHGDAVTFLTVVPRRGLRWK